MKRVKDLTCRFFVRLWYAHRNQAIVKAHKWLSKALTKREKILNSVPQEYRKEIMDTDPVLIEARNIEHKLSAFFKMVGGAE